MAIKFGSKGAGAFPTYFQASDSGAGNFIITPVEGEAKVTITPGDISDGFSGGIIPKIGATFINDATPPELSVITGSVYITNTIDAKGAITESIIKNDTTLPSDDPTYRYKQIGTVSVSGSTVTVTLQSIRASLVHKMCDTQSIWGSVE